MLVEVKLKCHPYLAYNSIIKHPICWDLKLLAVTHQRLSCSKKVINSTLHPASGTGSVKTLQLVYNGIPGEKYVVQHKVKMVLTSQTAPPFSLMQHHKAIDDHPCNMTLQTPIS